MMINLTLAVQAINFLIAYLMIKKLLLAPALAAITEDDAAIEFASIQLAEQKEAVIIDKKKLEVRLSDFQQLFLEHEPNVSQEIEKAITVVPGMPPLPTIRKKEIQELSRQTARKLIEEVDHVY